MPDGSPPGSERNTKLPGRGTTQARIGRSALARLSQLFETDAALEPKEELEAFSGNGTPYRGLCALGE